ncbi:MAG: site-2 protease family protein [Planctomycetota bacterium]|nr:site-2 protease family protein [Planctomycetota bacterium]
MDPVVTQSVLLYVVLLVSLVVHEASHATVALLGGDRTAYLGGQVTLNPIPHIQREPVGTVLLPILVLAASGGTMTLGYAPAPFDPIWAHRHPRRAALMSLAGPASNFLLCAIAFAGLKALVWNDLAMPYPVPGELLFVKPLELEGPAFAAAKILSTFLFLNLLLGIFNLLPWPPLDGAGVVEGVAPRAVGNFYGYLRTQPLMSLLGIYASWQVLPSLFAPALDAVVDWM